MTIDFTQKASKKTIQYMQLFATLPNKQIYIFSVNDDTV